MLPLLGGFDLQSGSLLPPNINARPGRDSQRRCQQAGTSQSGSKLSKLPHSKGQDSLLRFVASKAYETHDCARRRINSIVGNKIYERAMAKNVQSPDSRFRGNDAHEKLIEV